MVFTSEGFKVNERWSRGASAMPPKRSSWYAIAQGLNFGVGEMDEIAWEMGFDDAEHLDISISPSGAMQYHRRNFISALKQNVTAASGMRPGDIETMVDMPDRYFESVTAEGFGGGRLTRNRQSTHMQSFVDRGFTFTEGNKGWVARYEKTHHTSPPGLVSEVLFWADGFADGKGGI